VFAIVSSHAGFLSYETVIPLGCVHRHISVVSVGFLQSPNLLSVASVCNILHYKNMEFPPYEDCPKSIQPFWISREPVAWPWRNLAASQKRPYRASRGASQSAVKCRWLSLCTVWPSHSQISSLSTAMLALGKARPEVVG